MNDDSHSHQAQSSRLRTTSYTTAYRLPGCSLGEVLGLSIGVALGIGLWFTSPLAEPIFWYSLLAAIPAGYIAACPVNWWLIGKNLKHRH